MLRRYYGSLEKEGTIEFAVYDLIRGLVPEKTKKNEHPKSFYNMLTLWAQSVADELSAMQERYQWLHTASFGFVKQETRKLGRDVMSQTHPPDGEDTLNKAIHVMFKEDIRRPMIVKDGEIVSIVSIMDIFPELPEIAVDQCFID